jgi:hypothetical protein
MLVIIKRGRTTPDDLEAIRAARGETVSHEDVNWD